MFEDEPPSATAAAAAAAAAWPSSSSSSHRDNHAGTRASGKWRIACRNGSAVLLLAAIAAAAILVDLANPGDPRVSVKSVTVDLRNRAPVVEADLSFRLGTKLSRVEPLGLTASLESGDFRFDVRRTRGAGRNRYAATGTCPDSDVDSHAGRLWEVLTSSSSGGDVAGVLEDVLQAGTYSLETRTWLGHLVPWRHTIDDMPLEMLLDMGQERTDEVRPVRIIEDDDSDDSNDDEDDYDNEDDKNNNNNNNEEDKNKGENENENDAGSSIGICHMDARTLDVCIPLTLPSGRSSSLPSVLRIKTPALRAHAKPTYTEGLILSLDAWEGSFDPDDDAGGRNPSAVVSVSSADDHLPFYRPLLDLFLADVDSTTVAVTVDAEESFLEIFLGRHHDFFFENGSRDPAEFREEHRRQRHLLRKLAPNESTSSSSSSSSSLSPKNETYLQDYNDAAAHCIGAGEGNGDAFGFGLCWFLDLPRERLTLIGNMTIFDRSLLAVSEISWTVLENYFRIDMQAEALMVGEEDDDEFANLLGLVVWNATDETTIEVDLGFENTGSIWPFVANLETTIRTDDPDLWFRIDIDDLTLAAGDDDDYVGIVGATGGVSTSWTDDFEVDLRLDHGDSDFVAFELNTFNPSYYGWGLDLVTRCTWDDRELWDAGMNGLLSDSMDLSSTFVNATIYDLPSDTSLALGMYSRDSYDKSVLAVKLSNGQRDHASMGLELDFADFATSVKFVSDSKYDGDQLWDLVLDVALGSADTYYETSGWIQSYETSGWIQNMNLGLTESSSEFDLSVSAALEFQEEGGITTLETEIVHDVSDEVTMDLRWVFGTGEEEGEGDFVFDAASACVWDGQNRWASDLSLTVDDLTITAAIADSLHDFAMDAELDVTANDLDDTVAVTGSSNGILDEEEIFDMELRLMWEPFSYTDGGVIDVRIDEDVSDFNMLGKVEIFPSGTQVTDNEFILKLASFQIEVDGESYADTNGELKLISDYSRALINLQDNAKMDFVAEIDSRWYSSYQNVLVLDTLNVRRNEDVYLDGKANFTMDLLSLSMALDLDMPVATRQLETDLVFDLTDSFLVQSRVHYWWEEEDFVDLVSRIAYFDYQPIEVGGSYSYDYEGSWVELASVDQGNLGFAANLTAGVFDDHEMDAYSTSIERLLFSTKDDNYVDLSMKMIDFWNDTLESYQIELLSDTEAESDLQMNMEASIFSFDDYYETARMVVNRMVLGWRDTSYIEMPLRLVDSTDPAENDEAIPEVVRLSGISTRLEGMPALTDSTRIAFEKATEEFYTDLYRQSSPPEVVVGLRRRRRLERNEILFGFFATDVTVTGEDPDDNGNTVTYNQTISYVSADTSTGTSTGTTLSEADVRDILSSPFEAEASKAEYLELLIDRNGEFSRISKVCPPEIPSFRDDGSSKKRPAGEIAGITVGVLFLCGFCGCFGIYVVLRRRHYRTLKTEKYAFDASGAAFSNHEHSDDFFKSLERTRGKDKNDDDDNDDDSDVIDEDESTVEERSGDDNDNDDDPNPNEYDEEEDYTEEEIKDNSSGKEIYQDEYDDHAEDYIEEEIEEVIKEDTTGKEFYEDEYEDDAEDDIEEKPPIETTAADNDEGEKIVDGVGSTGDNEFRDEV